MRTDAFDLLIDRELFVVRWRNPTVAAARELSPLMERHHQEIGAPLLFGVLIGPDCPPPDQPTREALLRGHDRVYDCCRTVRMVLIGSELRQTVMRGVITAMTLAASLRGQAFHLDRTVRDFARVAARSLDRDAEQILAKLIAAGLVTADELDG